MRHREKRVKQLKVKMKKSLIKSKYWGILLLSIMAHQASGKGFFTKAKDIIKRESSISSFKSDIKKQKLYWILSPLITSFYLHSTSLDTFLKIFSNAILGNTIIAIALVLTIRAVLPKYKCPSVRNHIIQFWRFLVCAGIFAAISFYLFNEDKTPILNINLPIGSFIFGPIISGLILKCFILYDEIR